MRQPKVKTFVITGGGTGGHIYPALAIARGLTERYPGCRIEYVGGYHGLETSIVPRAGLPLTKIHCRGLERRISWQAVRALGETAWGLSEALWLLRRRRPDLVIGTGGFVALPVVMAATMLGIPAVIHEQNAYPGITNRLLASRVALVMLTFAEAAKRLKARRTVLTGLPVRTEIMTAERQAGRRFFQLPEKGQVILTVGGSRGAQRLNEAMPVVAQALASLPDAYLVHVTGEPHLASVQAAYRQVGMDESRLRILPYLERMEQALAACDLCIGRAGAAFLAELTVRGLPSILIPYPFAAENHQEANARSLVDAGAARMIVDRELTGETLTPLVLELLREPATLTAMGQAALTLGKPTALTSIIDEIDQLLQKG
ncbi:undecaprenyldiphospho-muramoylpentapeptide beta-N-acetylglucosaminyltransferase [Heliophilum fasciatum]|uniref:UDP-N-acetylglucosamine--N-acetylmuramyl-(pentapeptide) pyrophosphoryl-undecaprenol N-acetylglucosamine transferase n=1 Tax=Heliophilum fasciatum TaxID=35700 RepID=A0A4R2RF06_9FIRM|nr:undecaprenyldiphospho-muramoylpentapeptide beta-N-acetylglucosaminyltransferase [Heliophilum fasciatum]MCW2278856.1 UDP-N-acetylglucosamine--N-acetylmuramyl-(pentapeptide) pyrophosphoryl-undecaprenol N-acetylglucosamine transferase [Heliophilum fasciatum]TCP62132.1 UDP-N-acetylglucosamine-N-acetylmuramylpentapeptide N-acetylglucosamine transferase [Heliophilum fasciatum]